MVRLGGKGFAPFGSDDPANRPALLFPANHHLAQIFERAVVVAAVRGRYGSLERTDRPEAARARAGVVTGVVLDAAGF